MATTRRARLTMLAAGVVLGAGGIAAHLYRDRARPAANETGGNAAVRRIALSAGRLWLLLDGGSLASLKPDATEPEAIEANGRIADICRWQGRLVALAIEGDRQWSLQSRIDDRWMTLARIQAAQDAPVAMACSTDDPEVTVVTNRRLVEWDGVSVRSIGFDAEIQSPLENATAVATADAVWLGINAGEWGGGLRRIARSNGVVVAVERNVSGELCGGPLNAGCDPVNGIVAVPSRPSCVIAAVGLVHFMSHGRIVSVCGSEVRRIYFKPLAPQPPNNTLDDGEPSSTVAFFGLARSGDAIWAVGIDGVYRFDGTGAPHFRPLPRFRKVGGYAVSFDVPGIALVMTDVNARLSLSGSVPLLAAY